ncbi:MAG: hypothetical protein AUH92_06095 [Acidobacteria bacterium 13_1_40CM_4_69_4]|nr:MAG: hypothetical protein AUH92_06095 [Acidobacteria bacterium 13_1_40CM_4_69_4]
MPIARGRVTFIVTTLAIVLCPVACSRSGGPEVSSTRPKPQEAQSTPAAHEAKSEPAAAQEEKMPEAPELQPENATGAVKGVPAPTNTIPIVAVANYFTELPGIDVAGLKRGRKEKFLQRVNSEMCSCGCKNDTLARCYVNDPRCPVVKSMVQKVYDEVKAGK